MTSKYHNVITEYAGNRYHSKAEAEYARGLDMMARARNPRDRVVEWTPQAPYPIVVNGKKVATYYADFVVKYADGRTEVIDVKGVRTPMYRLKKKLVEASYGITIIEA